MTRLPRTVLTVLVPLVLCPAVGRTEDPQARQVLQQALSAAGGAESLNRLKAPMMWMEQGTYYGSGDQQVTYIGQYSSRWPDWYRQHIEGRFSVTVSGQQAWVTTGDSVRQLTGDALQQQLRRVRVSWARRLFPMTNSDVELSTVPDIEINGRTAVGLQAAYPDEHWLRLYFDAQSHRLVKLETQLVFPEQGPDPVKIEEYFSDHRGFAGVMMPGHSKQYWNGQLYSEADTIDYKVHATLDPELFQPPTAVGSR